MRGVLEEQEGHNCLGRAVAACGLEQQAGRDALGPAAAACGLEQQAGRKDGDPADIAAMLAERGPPKKRKKITEPADENSIVCVEPTPSGPVTMYFPPSQPQALSIIYPAATSRETTPEPEAPKEKKKRQRISKG